MPIIPSIPCPPAEDYDHAHSTASALASLSAMVASFDAIMDSLEQTTENYSKRMDSLTKRCESSRQTIQKMKSIGEKGIALTIRSPASFPTLDKEDGTSGDVDGGGGGGGGNATATATTATMNGKAGSSSIMGRSRPKQRKKGYYEKVNDGKSSSTSGQAYRPSPLDCARRASNEAFLNVLHEDWKKDDGLASPSDLWLDRASGFDEGALCRSAEQVHTVPSLMYNIKMEEMEMIEEILLEQRKSSGDGTRGDYYYDGATTATSTNTNIMDGGFSENKSVAANDVFEQFQNSTFSSASSAWNATGADEANIMDMHEDDTSIITSSTIFTAAASRKSNVPYPYQTSRQFKVQDEELSTPRLFAATGSQPFLCELLHDSYGVGSKPPSSDTGSYFSATRTVGELLFFNSDQECYKKSSTISEDEIESDNYGSSWESTGQKNSSQLSLQGDKTTPKAGPKAYDSIKETKQEQRTDSKSVSVITENKTPEKDEVRQEMKEKILLFSPQSNSTISSPNIENFQPGDSKVNSNPLQLPDNLPLDAVISAFNEDSNP